MEKLRRSTTNGSGTRKTVEWKLEALAIWNQKTVEGGLKETTQTSTSHDLLGRRWYLLGCSKAVLILPVVVAISHGTLGSRDSVAACSSVLSIYCALWSLLLPRFCHIPSNLPNSSSKDGRPELCPRNYGGSDDGQLSYYRPSHDADGI